MHIWRCRPDSPSQAIRAVPCAIQQIVRVLLEFFDQPAARAMEIISPAVDDADPLAAANGARAPRPAPAANSFDPAAALSLSDVINGTTTTATAADVVAAGTTPWWSSQPPCYAGWDAYASSSFPPPPLLQCHGNDLAGYAGSIMDTSFPPPPPAVYMQPELSYLYNYPQPPQGFPPSSSCFAAPFALEPTTAIWPELLQAQPASLPPPPYCPQTQAATPGSAASVEEASPALADTQLQAQEDDTSRPARRRRGRPSKRAPAVAEPTKRVAVGRNDDRAASSSSSSSQKTISAATATGAGSATMSSAPGQVVPDQAGTSSSSTGSTSGQSQTVACTDTNSPVAALLCDERCQLQQRPAFSNGGGGGPAGVVVDGHHQQAAIEPSPELMATTGPEQYADTSPVGVRLHPTDQELIGYLRRKYARQPMPVDIFKEFDVYHAHPMAIKGACGESQNGCWYAFSKRDRKYRNGKRPARSVFAEGSDERVQVGFWKSNSKLGEVRAGGKKDGAVIGRMTSLTFHLGQQPKGEKTGWKMKEYTIPENQHQPDGSAMLLNDWVVCKLFYKERPTSTKTKSKTDESAMPVGQKRPRRSRKSKKDKNVIPVAVGQEEDGLVGEAAGESMQGEGDMQQTVVLAAHQASDYSEQDLCLEDYLVYDDDVPFAQQDDDPANCTI